MNVVFGGITYPTTIKKTGIEIAKVTVNKTIFEGIGELSLSFLFSEIFILVLKAYTVNAPIPSPKNAIEIAIKA